METVKPSLLRKYFFEYAIIALCFAVSFLFYQYQSLNTYIRNVMNEQLNRQVEIIQKNTETQQEIKSFLFLNSKSNYNEKYYNKIDSRVLVTNP